MKIRAFAIASLSVLAVSACSQPAADTASTTETPAGAGDTAAAPAEAATGLAAVAAGTWTASGTEPFWELKVAPGQALDVTVEGASIDVTGPYAAPVIQPDGSAVITTGNLVVTLSAGPCEAIGPTRYPYTATVAMAGEAEPAYRGCAETPTEPRVEIDEATGQPVAAEAK